MFATGSGNKKKLSASTTCLQINSHRRHHHLLYDQCLSFPAGALFFNTHQASLL